MSRTKLPSERIIGANLRALREHAGCSQMRLAAALGVTFQQVQKYEKGDCRLTADRLHSLHLYFRVPYDYFFHGIDGHAAPDMALLHGDRTALEAFQLIKAITDLSQKQKILDVVKILTA